MKDKFEEDLQTGIENYGRTGYETMANIDRLHKQVGSTMFLMIIAKVFNNHNSYKSTKHVVTSSLEPLYRPSDRVRKKMENYAEILGNIMQK